METIDYQAKDQESRINELVREEIHQQIFKKKYNLAGEISDEGGIDVYRSDRLVTTKNTL